MAASRGWAVSTLALWALLLIIFSVHSSTAAKSHRAACATCRRLTSDLAAHMLKTADSNFGGGNSAWEARSLGSWAKSETRFEEVLEHACSSGDYKCHTMLEKHEDFLGDWWRERNASKDAQADKMLERLLCIDELKVRYPMSNEILHTYSLGLLAKNSPASKFNGHALPCLACHDHALPGLGLPRFAETPPDTTNVLHATPTAIPNTAAVGPRLLIAKRVPKTLGVLKKIKHVSP
ncbi:uncharacterized protein MONBRDRAFT_23120 [Monosiga brevicollis MX1]|uniref:Cytochrome c domain-containing protein n=1 Tax=Monosiga brevicollis TaxID=81824 RepID=A9UR88_MONBE|nr:uncharacterized protein MONBRDRAFT_23120 [Monosiga brevicollis MX1]EDQ91882.1 predicted protein [Monosiga brevicollis MX1]|eukprot:XP_001743168.1 hypothetical protein [Monosiga brevicollis MX1]